MTLAWSILNNEPLASERSARDCEILSGLGLNAKVASHVRCHMTDVSEAIKSGGAGHPHVHGNIQSPQKVFTWQRT
eukprot:TRINITY_DN4351_c0_g1_i1.p2 TRINITY_DN4351_c0_g1~~TRINITY_DN4351_c0_g1_i1.p2  ORF type:complete len:76 (+),score=11.88 TRINITY_DN4351_c0_g1_i1:228-455(+)